MTYILPPVNENIYWKPVAFGVHNNDPIHMAAFCKTCDNIVSVWVDGPAPCGVCAKQLKESSIV